MKSEEDKSDWEARAELAWQYLIPGRRLRRRVDDVELLSARHARRVIDIDVGAPAGVKRDSTLLIPAVFLSKEPVAPDLVVRDAAGAVISVPTKAENMHLSLRALAELDRDGALELDVSPPLRDLVRQTVFSRAFEAGVARVLAEQVKGAGNEVLTELLRLLEAQFLLWVPVDFSGGLDQHFSISRQEALVRNPVLPRRPRARELTFETAMGRIQVTTTESTGPPTLDLSSAARRILELSGLSPQVHRQEVIEADRFQSFHLRVRAPQTFVVRDAAAFEDLHGRSERDEELVSLSDDSDVVIQGAETGLAHLHCAREPNPERMVVNTLMGLQTGTVTIWAASAIFTAVLLWLFYRAAPYPIDSDDGSLELAGAILLVGPPLAVGWAIRYDQGEVVNALLRLSRTLLLISAFTAVAAALSLAGIRAGALTHEQSLEFLASISFLVAAAMAVGWLVTRRSIWLLYRGRLSTSAANFWALAACAFAVAMVSIHDPHDRVLGLVTLGAGLCFAAIAANPLGARSATDLRSGGYVEVGTVFAAVALLSAGCFLGFNRFLEHTDAHWVVTAVALAMVATAAVAARRSIAEQDESQGSS